MLGRITLNPLPHIDPIMSIAFPAITFLLSGGQFVFGGAKPVPVTLTFTLAGKELKVRYEDGARRYDPFQRLNPRHSLEDTVELRPLGGLGVLLIRELGKDARYAWAKSRNCVTFSMPTDAPVERKK